MVENNKGVTLIALITTVVVMIILTGVSINTGFTVVKDVRIGRVLSNMKLVEGKMAVLYDDYKFYNNDSNYLEGQGPIKIDSTTNKLEEVALSAEEIELIAINANVNIQDVYSWNWYRWDLAELEAQDLDQNMLEKNHVFFVNYEYNELIYSEGTSYNNVDYYYSKTGLTKIFNSNGE